MYSPADDLEGVLDEAYDATVREVAAHRSCLLEERPGMDAEAAVAAAVYEVAVQHPERQALLLAHALLQGVTTWGKPVDWQAVEEMLGRDVSGYLDER